MLYSLCTAAHHGQPRRPRGRSPRRGEGPARPSSCWLASPTSAAPLWRRLCCKASWRSPTSLPLWLSSPRSATHPATVNHALMHQLSLNRRQPAPANTCARACTHTRERAHARGVFTRSSAVCHGGAVFLCHFSASRVCVLWADLRIIAGHYFVRCKHFAAINLTQDINLTSKVSLKLKFRSLLGIHVVYAVLPVDTAATGRPCVWPPFPWAMRQGAPLEALPAKKVKTISFFLFWWRRSIRTGDIDTCFRGGVGGVGRAPGTTRWERGHPRQWPKRRRRWA